MKITITYFLGVKWMLLNLLLITFSIVTYSQGDVAQRSPESPATDNGTSSKQKEVLIDLYSDLEGELWQSKTKWLEDDDICLWQGVSCVRDTKDVESLYLANNNMEGALDIIKLLNDIPTLKRLNLEFNNIDFISELEDIEVVSNVEELVLNGIYFDDIYDLLFLQVSFPDLKLLSLRDCKLIGEIPFFSFITLPKLEKLDLNDNDYDTFPDENDVKMPELNYLSINTNALVGDIPEYLADYTKLRFLFLKENYFEGSLDVITKLPELESVDVSAQLTHDDCENGGSGFTGTVPAFNTQPKLRRINIRRNCLTGSLPKNLLDGINVPEFEYFMIDENKLTGIIPSSPTLLNLPVAAYFLDDNQFTSIDEELCIGKEFECDSILCPLGTYNEIGRQISIDKPCLACSKNTQYIGVTYCGSKFNIDDDAFDDDELLDDDKDYELLDDELLDDYNVDENGPISNFEDEEFAIGLSEYEILEMLYLNTGGEDWEKANNWLQNDDYCSWDHINCN